MIPYGKQNLNQADIDAVVEVLQSDFLTQGKKVPEFEQTVANYCHAQYATATNSATSALHIACLALDVGQGDWVWTSPISFVASSNCALYCGAQVDFVDIDLDTGNLSVQTLEQKLIQAQKENKLPKVVIPVHLAGQSCDMQGIHALSQTYGFKIIEDASHAIGGRYQAKPVGSCEYSDITVFSFHPVKIITTGEGGMALTNQPELDKKLKRLRSHGITSTEEEMTEPSHGPWYYQQQELGFNYRMTDIQAALGLSQLNRLDEFVQKRNELAAYYNQNLNTELVTPLAQQPNRVSAYHLYIVKLKKSDTNKHKQAIIGLRAAGIMAHVHYIPIYLQPYYQSMGFDSKDFPNAQTYYHSAITLPLYPILTLEQQDYICEILNLILA